MPRRKHAPDVSTLHYRENRRRLRSAGAVISDNRPLRNPKEWDIVVNYHVAQILKLRKELLDALRKEE